MKLRRVEVTNWKTGEKRKALFHQFGLDLEDSDDENSSSYTVAIVEYPDGSVEFACLKYIRFLDSPEAAA